MAVAVRSIRDRRRHLAAAPPAGHRVWIARRTRRRWSPVITSTPAHRRRPPEIIPSRRGRPYRPERQRLRSTGNRIGQTARWIDLNRIDHDQLRTLEFIPDYSLKSSFYIPNRSTI